MIILSLSVYLCVEFAYFCKKNQVFCTCVIRIYVYVPLVYILSV
jgi:hypothetical protein